MLVNPSDGVLRGELPMSREYGPTWSYGGTAAGRERID
jgi:hypothetical protein